MNTNKSSWAFLLLAGLFFWQPGCSQSGEPGCVVTGKILKGGMPLEVQGREIGTGVIEVTLIPEEAGGQAESTFADEAGLCRFEGAGRGIAPGRYKVAVRQWEPYGVTDKLDGEFADDATTITLDVPEEQLGGSFDWGVIDLGEVSP